MADATDPTEHNRRIADAVKHYCKFPHKQGFAVMVDGPWGSGKTHLVESLMDDLAEENPLQPLQKPLYVSLYGVKDVGEINDQLFQQMHPVLGHKYTRLGARILRGALKATLKFDIVGESPGGTSIIGQMPELKMSEIMGDATKRILIFDDFERSVMTPIESLGYINALVEHDGCKVLVLANEAEIDKIDTNYARRREKTIGRTMRLKADARAAYPSFLNQVTNKGAREYLESIVEDILTVFKESGLDNLRLLNQFVWDFERFWLTLTEEQRAHQQTMRELATLLCAAALELRSGRTDPASFRRADISHFMRGRSKDPDPDTLAAADLFKRYPTVSFEGALLAPETVREIILDSAFPAQSVQDQLQGNPLFEKPQEIPSWRALWHSFDLDEAELQAVLATFQKDFDARTFRSEDEILHVAGLCLWLSDLGQPGWDGATVVARLESYVDEVYASSVGVINPARRSSIDKLAHGAYNLGFFNSEDPRFAIIARRVDEAAEAQRRRAYPEIAAQLLHTLASDAEAFLRDLCFTEPGPARYARLGVLSHISPRDFATAVAASKYGDQKKVAMALSLRYDQVQGEADLQSELPWLSEMMRELETIAAAMAPIPRHHLRSMFAHYVQKHVPQPPGEPAAAGERANV